MTGNDGELSEIENALSWASSVQNIFWTQQRRPLVCTHPSKGSIIDSKWPLYHRKRWGIDWDSRYPPESQQRAICYLSQFPIVSCDIGVVWNLLYYPLKGVYTREARAAAFKIFFILNLPRKGHFISHSIPQRSPSSWGRLDSITLPFEGCA